MHKTVLSIPCVVMLMALCAVAGPWQRSARAEEDESSSAKKVWRDNCAKCHTVPDATYETGRAFLAQITETS